jgi:hypothetical protein
MAAASLDARAIPRYFFEVADDGHAQCQVPSTSADNLTSVFG